MVGLVFAPHPCALNKKCLSFYDVQIILLPFFEIFAPFGSTKKHSSLPLQIDLSTPWCTLSLAKGFDMLKKYFSEKWSHVGYFSHTYCV